MYLTIPFVALLDPNEWSVRLPCAIAGIIFVILSYYLGLLIFKDKNKALLLMFLVAISPWTLFPSRAVFQSTIASTIMLAGIVLIMSKFSIWGFALLILSMFAYHNTRIIALPLGLSAIYLYGFKNKNKKSILYLAIFIAAAIPSLVNLLSPGSRARSQWVGILSPAAINQINENRRLFTGHPPLNRIINNKITYFVPRFFQNYLNLFNPVPLFFTGSNQFQFNVANHGLLFTVSLPFFYLGLIKFSKKIKANRHFQFMAIWYLLALLPAALTTGDFPTIRAVTVLPLPFILIILGLEYLPNIIPVFTIIIIIQFALYWQKYQQYNVNYSSSWQYGYKQVVEFIKDKYPEYQQIILTKKYGEPHEFILFYWPWDPANFQDRNPVWNYHSSWYWVDAFDKFVFINDWEIKEKTSKLTQKTLLITSPGNYYPENSQKLSTINFLNGQPAFDIITYESEN
jgi:4-amino-4-deoxy-L-arabinose transferase-like glycosyltransferase